MASPTNKVEKRRAIRRAKAGMWRKNRMKNHGSVYADLPLDRPNANERAQKKVKA